MTETKIESKDQDIHFFDGLEIGAVSVKWVRRNSIRIVNRQIIRHGGNPTQVIKNILSENYSEDYSKVAVTGETAKGLLNLPYFAEAECLEKALSSLDIQPDILLSLGGETFTIYPMKDGEIKNIISTSKCQAGSGEFIVQQFQRMGYTIEDGIEAAKTGNVVKLATRCSVHCKSDATHKLNKGECSPNDIAITLIGDLAKKVSDMINLAQWPKKHIILTGNVSKNELFIQNLSKNLENSNIKVLDESAFLESYGASLLAESVPYISGIATNGYIFNNSTDMFEILTSLNQASHLLDYRVVDKSDIKVIDGDTYILGIDAGSTTTKAVLFNVKDKSIGASIYLRTLGNPIQATKQCLEQLIEQKGTKKIDIIQCAVTGSAREMVSVYLDNCLTFNEILAHARGASEEVPNVDTVFEIGGQDSKFISFLGGIPVDYAMNEGCSAGTGSFLEESASVDMQIPVTEIAPIAKKSKSPISFGERCAAFINTDLRNALQQGASQENVVAGLVYSIADNYISRIVGPRHLGDTILFLGGVALNEAVGLAIASRVQRKVVVPGHPELMGAWGAALMSQDLLNNNAIRIEDYPLEKLVQGEMQSQGTFRCAACENNCEIQKISIRGKSYPFGGLCSKYWLQRHKNQKLKSLKEGNDLVAFRNQLMFDEFGAIELDNPIGTIGIPMGLLSYEIFPFYAKFFNEIGYNVVLTEYETSDNIKQDVKAPICYPCEIVHVGVRKLIEKGVDFIFLPYVLETDYQKGYLHGYTCPNTTTIPDIIRSAFEGLENMILRPHMSLAIGQTEVTVKELERLSVRLKVKKSKVRTAVNNAFKHYRKFKENYLSMGEEKIEKLLEKPSVILAGRPYVIASSNVNLALPRKIVSRGYNVIPMDILPIMKSDRNHRRNAWTFTQQINNAVSFVKSHPNAYICFVSCFSCGIDATMYHEFRQRLEGETFCYLEIDSHTAHAGFETRVGAFLEIIEERRRKKPTVEGN